MNFKQNGVVALTTTIIILFIATLGVLYANKASFLFQKKSNNNYQYDMALQAAEYGITEIMPVLTNDMALLEANPNDSNTIFLEKNTAPAATTECNAGANAAAPYKLKKTNLANNLTLINSLDNTAPGLAYNVLLQINSGKITAVSTGCAGNTIANGDSAICSEAGNSNAIVRRVIDLGASLTPASSGISSRGYIDTDVSVTVDLNAGKTTKANCGILFGSGGKDATDSPDNCDATINASTGKADKWRPENDPTYCLSSTKGKTGADKTTFDGANASTKIDSALAGQSGDEFFASYFGGLSKTEVKAAASNNGVVVSPAACPTTAQVAAVRAAKTKILWIDGDLNLTAPCSSLYAGPNQPQIAVIINGDVKNTVGQMQVSDALLYANNIYQNGAFKITDGSLVLEGNWDVDTEGKTITDVHGTSHGANTKKDALSSNITNQQNKTARGSLHVSYAPINIQITLPSTDKKPDNWIDF